MLGLIHMESSLLLQKEHALYERVILSQTDREFLVSFCDYMNFLKIDGATLVSGITVETNNFLSEKNDLNTLEKSIIDKIQKLTTTLEKKTKALGIFNEKEINWDFFDIKTKLNGNSSDINLSPLKIDYGDISMDLGDIVQKVIDLGFEKNVQTLFKQGKRSGVEMSISKDIEDFVNKEDFYTKRYTKSITQSLDFLKEKNTLFEEFDLKPSAPKINTDEYSEKRSMEYLNTKIFEKIHTKQEYNDYVGILTEKTAELSVIPKTDITNHLQRIHFYIQDNNQGETIEHVSKKVFFVKNNRIHHYNKGELSYQIKEPKYIKILRRIVEHFPEGDTRIKISDFEKKFPKSNRFGKDYRLNVGRNSTSFQGFLKRNNIENIHPKNKKPILEATDAYIIFNNIF